MSKTLFSQFTASDFKKSIGFLTTGEEIFSYRLKNKNGMELDVINYGATITSLIKHLASKV